MPILSSPEYDLFAFFFCLYLFYQLFMMTDGEGNGPVNLINHVYPNICDQDKIKKKTKHNGSKAGEEEEDYTNKELFHMIKDLIRPGETTVREVTQRQEALTEGDQGSQQAAQQSAAQQAAAQQMTAQQASQLQLRRQSQLSQGGAALKQGAQPAQSQLSPAPSQLQITPPAPSQIQVPPAQQTPPLLSPAPSQPQITPAPSQVQVPPASQTGSPLPAAASPAPTPLPEPDG